MQRTICEQGRNGNSAIVEAQLVRSAAGTPSIMKIPKTRVPSHTIIGATHSSSVIHVAMKRPPPKKAKLQKKKVPAVSERRNFENGKERVAGEIIMEEPVIEYVGVVGSIADENSQPVSKGTTTNHFVNL